MANNRTEVLINDKFMVYLTTEKQILRQRSSLLQAKLDNHDSQDNQPIQIELQRPEKCFIIFHYLDTLEKCEELTNFITFASYINDVTHLGIQPLLDDFDDLLRQILQEKKGHMVDFKISRPHLEFMENYFQHNRDLSSFSCFDLILNWMGTRADSKQSLEGLLQHVKFDLVIQRDLDVLKERYPEAYEIIMDASSEDETVVTGPKEAKTIANPKSKKTKFH
eukprot:TRINITY_DN24618_c0_g1_i1.p1 TRINITY_DN24618_c0_g1~~TRINITY_DN24618_c0_g1_i1.p1  ORF type:complete len:222 (-),score=26.44 TRINITY_DN24618_c0_g1_i1:456-1121(-)